MNKQTIINKFLEDKDLKEHELVYWKHKVSNGFKLKKFMEDFIDYYDKQLKLSVVSQQSELLAFLDWVGKNTPSYSIQKPKQMVDAYLKANSG